VTPKQKAVIERARLAPARVVVIDRREGRLYRETAMINTLRKLRDEAEDAFNQARLDAFNKN